MMINYRHRVRPSPVACWFGWGFPSPGEVLSTPYIVAMGTWRRSWPSLCGPKAGAFHSRWPGHYRRVEQESN